jgi:hypothetical protein
MTSRLFSFVGGNTGRWRVAETKTITGAPLPAATRVDIVAGDSAVRDTAWLLRGLTSNERYVTRAERNRLVSVQQGLARPEATFAALIPIRKSAAWWALSQDERRAIFEESSRHVTIGLRYLPAVARRLHHCRDLSEDEPFDFLTWFEYAPADESAFDELVRELRASPEWGFVDRELDIRLRLDVT